jgi:hypothetical protein
VGWWSQDKNGFSFAEDSDMIWGDGPADTIGEAIDSIVAEFVEDTGRRPTRDEIHAGLDFSLRAVEGYWDVEARTWNEMPS